MGEQGSNWVPVATIPNISPTSQSTLGGGSHINPCNPCGHVTKSTKEPIDTGDGDYYHTFNEFSVDGSGTLPLSLSLTYDSQSAYSEASNSSTTPAFGYGWSSNIDESLTPINYPTPGSMLYTDSNGAQVPFMNSSSSTCYGSYTGWQGPSGSSGNFCSFTNTTATLVGNYSSGSLTGYTLTSENGQTIDFNASGQLSGIGTLNEPNAISVYQGVTPGTNGCPSSAASCTVLKDPSGDSEVAAFNSAGNIYQVTSPDNQNWDFTYNLNSDLTSIVDPSGGVTSYSYDTQSGNPSPNYIVNSLNTIVYPNEQAGQPDAGKSTSIFYYPGTSCPSVINPTNIDDGFAYKEIEGDGSTTTLDYSQLSNTSAANLGTGLISSWIPSGTTLITEPNGSVSADSYSFGVLVSHEQNFGTNTARQESYQHDPSSLMDTEDVLPNGTVVTKGYDSGLSVDSETDSLGNVTKTSYNGLNEPTCTASADAIAANYSCACTSSLTTSLSRNQILLRCLPVTLPLPPNPGVSVASQDQHYGVSLNFYDSSGNRTAHVDADGNVTIYAYTTGTGGVPAGLLYCTIPPIIYESNLMTSCPSYPVSAAEQKGLITETFDSKGEMLTQTDASGGTTTYTYGSQLDQPLTTTDPEGDVTSYTYDQEGRVILQSVSNPGSTYSSYTQYAYDLNGNLFCTVLSNAYSLGDRCPSSEPTGIPSANSNIYPGATVEEYDSQNQVVYSINSLGGITQYAYDQSGNQYCVVSPNEYNAGISCPATEPTSPIIAGADPYMGATITEFDSLGDVIEVANPLGGTTTNTFDGSGNITSTTVDSGNGNDPARTTYFQYNADNEQVASCIDPDGDEGDSPGLCNGDTDVAADTGNTSQDTYNQSFYDPSGNVYCTTTLLDSGTCPSWSDTWFTTPPSTPASGVSTTFLDPNGNVIQSTSSVGATTLSSYDPAGNQLCSVDPVNVKNGTTCGAWTASYLELRSLLGINRVDAMSCVVDSLTQNLVCEAVISTFSGAIYAFSSWTGIQYLPSDVGSITSISCDSNKFCMTVGTSSSGSPQILTGTYYGSAPWVDQSSLIPSTIGSLNSIGCQYATSDICLTGGENTSGVADGFIFDDSTNPATISSPNFISGLQSVTSLTCPTTSFCIVTGAPSTGSSTEALVSNGSLISWNPVTITGVNQINYISCATSTFCVGSATTNSGSPELVYYDGSWSTNALPSGALSLGEVSCAGSSAPACFTLSTSNASGSLLPIVLQTVNGTSWTTESLPQSMTSASTISCSNNTFCSSGGGSAISAQGVAVALTGNGTSWELGIPTPGTTNTYVNEAGLIERTFDQLGNVTLFQYDQHGNKLAVIDANGNASTYCYYYASVCGTKVPPSGGGLANMVYQTVTPASPNDPNGLVTNYTYDKDGNKLTATTPAATTTYGYNVNNQITSLTYSGIASGFAVPSNVLYSYSQDGSRESMVDGTGTTDYTYNANGNVSSQSFTAANNGQNCTDYCTVGLSSYNGLNTTQSLAYGYYGDGNLETVTYPIYNSSMTATEPKATYVYDSAGNMSSVSDGLGNVVSFAYDTNGNLISQINGTGSSASTATWKYDSANNLILNSDYGIGLTSSGVSPANSSSVSTANTLSPTTASSTKKLYPFGLSPSTNKVSMLSSSGCIANSISISQDMGYSVGSRNLNGQLTDDYMTLSICGGGSLSGGQYYSYNTASQVSYEGTSSQGSSNPNFCYDNSGNLTYFTSNNVNNNPQSYVASVNQASELTSHSSPGSSNVPCSNIAGSSNNVTSYSYDSLGDRISATVGSSNYSYGYNGIGEMTSYSSGGTNNFSYTGDGLEIAGQSGSVTTQLTWDTTGSLPLLLCDGTDDYIYGPSGTPVEQINTTTVQSASLTSPSMDNPTYMSYTPGISSWIISNTAGYFTNISRYDAYGNLTAGNPGSVFGWQGQYMGSGSNYSGLIYMRARYYDPTSGEFTSMDPLYLSTYQAYEYAGGDPVNGSDPSGASSASTVSLPVSSCWAGGTVCPSVDVSTLTGRQEYVFLAFSYMDGWTPIMAAAVAGNFTYESGGRLDPSELQGGCTRPSRVCGVGIAQWGEPDRFPAMVTAGGFISGEPFDSLSKTGWSPTLTTMFTNQVAFAQNEFESDYLNVTTSMQASEANYANSNSQATSQLEEAVAIVQDRYEIGYPNAARYIDAANILNTFGPKVGQVGQADPGAEGSSNAATGVGTIYLTSLGGTSCANV